MKPNNKPFTKEQIQKYIEYLKNKSKNMTKEEYEKELSK